MPADHRRLLFRLQLALTLALTGAAAARAETRIEPPMRVASQAPLQSTRLALVPASAGYLRAGEVRLELTETWTNVWVNQRPAMLLDYEAVELRLSATWAVSDTWSLQMDIDERRRFGGALDAAIQNFHRLIGNGLNGRDSVPRNAVTIEVTDPDTGQVRLSLSDEGTFSRGVSATVGRSNRLLGGRATLGASLRVPLRHAGEELATGSDIGVSAGWSGKISRSSIHFGAAVTRLGRVEVDYPIRRIQKTALAAYVHPLTRRTAAVVQYLYNDGTARSGPLGRDIHEVTIGGRFYISPRTSVDLGLIENVLHYDNGPDVGIHIGISRIWPSTKTRVEDVR